MAEPGEFPLLVAALKAGRADLESYGRVLSDVLGDALPPGMVEIDRRRSFADRIGGREGRPVEVRVTTADRVFVLGAGKHGGVVAGVRHVVRGVVIKREESTVDNWLELLARDLAGLAERDARAREALSRLLGG